MSHLVPRRPSEHSLGSPMPQRPADEGAYPQVADDSLDIREILSVLRRHMWLVLASVVLVTAAAVFVVSRQEPQYRASAMIRLKNERQAMTGSLQNEALDQMMGRTADPLLSQIEQMRSRSVASAVVSRLGLRLQPVDGALRQGALAVVYVPERAQPDTLRLRFGNSGYELSNDGSKVTVPYGEPARLNDVELTIVERPDVAQAQVAILTEEQAIDRVRTMRASPREKTDVVEVSYTSNDPELSQAVVNAAVDVFQRWNAESAQEQSRRRRVFLEAQLVKTDSALAAMQGELSAFREREQVFSSRERFAAQQSGLMDLEIKREELLAERRVYNSLLDGLNRQPQDGRGLRALVSAPGLAANPMVTQLYQQLVRYEQTRDSLTTGQFASSQSNPDVQRLNTLITNAQRNLVDAARSHVASLDARIGSMEEMLARNSSQMRGLPDKEAEEMRLAQQVETARQLADQLRSEYQRAQIEEAVEVGQVEIIDRAPMPADPIGSGKSVKIALGLILGLMVGGSGAFLREQLNTKLTRKDEIESVLGLPALAVIPRIEHTNGRPKSRLPLRRSLTGSSASAAVAVDRPLQELITVGDVRSSGAEAFRSLRTNLIFSQKTQSLKSLMVSSPVAAEGKTTTAANLAVTFAQQGLRVVIVDCDLRKARMHRVFNVEREPGLVDALIGNVTLADAARPTPVPNLSVIPAGMLPPNPAELLGSRRMHEVLTELEATFDLVILDAPPVLVAGDASIVGAMAGGTVVVVRASKTERDAANAAVQQLRTVGARILGAVLNDPDAKIPKHEGGYYYAYSYYGDEE